MNQAEYEELHRSMIHFVGRYHKAQANLLDLIQESDREKLYLHLGYPSLFAYLVEGLCLSEACACNFINVARKAIEVPALKEAVATGRIGVSKLRKLCPVITTKNQDEWLSKANNLNSRDLERAVAEQSPEPSRKEHIQSLSQKTSRIRIDVDFEFLELLEHCRNLMSNNKVADISMADTIKTTMSLWLDKNDPVAKAKRAEKRKTQGKKPVDHTHKSSVTRPDFASVVQSQKRNPIRSGLVHKVHLRDRNRCQFVSKDGRKCNQTRHLHFHHIKSVSDGGTDSLDNLVTLCAAHHRQIHNQ